MRPRKGCEETTMQVREVSSFVIFATKSFVGVDRSYLQVLRTEPGVDDEPCSDEEKENSDGEEDIVEALGKERKRTLKVMSSAKKGTSWVCWSDGLHDINRVKTLSNDPYQPPAKVCCFVIIIIIVYVIYRPRVSSGGAQKEEEEQQEVNVPPFPSRRVRLQSLLFPAGLFLPVDCRKPGGFLRAAAALKRAPFFSVDSVYTLLIRCIHC